MEKEPLTIQKTQQQLVSGKISAEELFKEVLSKIKEQEHRIGAFITLTEEEALRRGRRLDQKLQKGSSLSSLEGALYSVKDNIMVKNIKCTCGSKMLKNFIAPFNGESITALDEAGGISLGKTNLDEFAMGSSTEHSAFKVTRNPLDHKRVAGGSSGGSAAAVAAGFGHFSIGSDTGGSLRQPAAFCGVLGLKPTYGLVSRQGLVSFAPSMDQIGVLANNCWDLARVLEVLQGKNPAAKEPTKSTAETKQTENRGNPYKGKKSILKDYTMVRSKPISYYRELTDFAEDRRNQKEPLLKGMTIGIPKEFFEGPVEKAVEKALDASMERLQRQGARLRQVSIPHLDYALSAYHIITMAEAVSNLARFDGVAYGTRASKTEDIRELIEKSRGQGFGEEVKRRLIFGNHILTNERDSFVKAKKVQALLKQDFQRAFQQVDLLFTPTTSTTAFKLGKKSSPLDMQRLDEFTVAASITGLPAISVPCQQPGSLPVGGQLIGNYFEELTLLTGALGLQLSSAGPTDEHKEER